MIIDQELIEKSAKNTPLAGGSLLQLQSSESDVCRHQILTTKVAPRAVRLKYL